jgi:hypothetical protein
MDSGASSAGRGCGSARRPSRIRAELASRRVLDASAVVEGKDGARRIGVAAERIEVTFVEGEVARGRRRRGLEGTRGPAPIRLLRHGPCVR